MNHFPRTKELCRKDNLKRHLDRLVTLRGFKHAGQFRIMPQTFVLPHDYLAFIEYYSKDTARLNANKERCRSIW